MSKLIKLTDAVGEALAKMAAEDNLSMAGEVAKLLATAELPPSPVDTSYFDKKFNELKSLIEDTLVDRIDTHKKDPLNEKVYVEWDIARELLYDFLDEKATEWRPGVYSALQSSDAELNCYIQDGYLCTDDHYGKQHLMVQVSPRVDQFLANKIEEKISVA